MSGATIHSSEACELISRLEELLECQILCFVVSDASYYLSFMLPGGIADDDVALVLEAIGWASQNAVKSL